MSAQSIYDQAPIGALIRYSDGTPRPPQRFKHKLAAWENNNNGGRLVRKAGASYDRQPHDTGEFHAAPGRLRQRRRRGAQGLQDLFRKLAADVHRRRTAEAWHGARSRSGWGTTPSFSIWPADRAAAQAWLASHRYSDAVLDAVIDDDTAAGPGEGRAA